MEMDQSVTNKMTDAYNLIEKANDMITSIFFESVLFSLQWWIGFILAVVPWVLWIFLRKKDSTWRLLTAGLFVLFVSSWFDLIGISLGLWHYHSEVVPTIPAFFPWDFTLLPVITMALIQIKPNVNPVIKAIIFAFLSSYVAETIFEWLDMYDREEWKLYYSFFIYIIIYLLADFIATRKSYAPL
ncbi:CBO0543 family protein [Pontibacillus yanchengensis]|uniref:Uncharacterized protein n=1 Tax=Pontibacillus yanchengensis Y32 TaxID=1385514 RepID=A0A0A2TU66_9BACI|nr:CBO0543 family protein [Pontibacillus yanchengensis]KGP72790.1 hypothetical protein N782_10540 [Pontibacillus yanchengensis Y32]